MAQNFNYIRWRLILGKHSEKNPNFSLTDQQTNSNLKIDENESEEDYKNTL